MIYSNGIVARLLGSLFLLATFALESFGIEAVWIGGPAGDWTEATNWSTGVVPAGILTNVTIDDNPAASSAVLLDSTITIGDATIDTGDQLGIESGGSLTADFITVDGDLVMQAATQLRPNAFLWIEPNGHLSMTDNLAQTGSLVIGVDSAVLWNQGRISGAGAIGSGMPLSNEGFIVGDIQGQILSAIIHSSLNYNTGEMLATDGGALLIRPSGSSATLYNFEGGAEGLIQARGANAVVRVEAMTVVGGEISTAADEANVHGTINLLNVTLRDIRLEGNIIGSRITLQGTIENNTMVQSDTGASTFVSISSPTTLTGSGRLEMGRSFIDGPGFTSSTDPLLVNDVNHTIAGAGSIFSDRFHFKNHGTVEAHPVPGDTEMTLQLGTTQTAVNSGVLRATGQATLNIAGSTTSLVFENYEGDDVGVIEADVDSIVRIGNHTVRGGVLRSIAPPEGESGQIAGRILSNLSTPTMLRDVRLEGTIGDEASGWRITGQIENTGVFRGGELVVENDAMLTGGGRLELGQGFSGTALIRGGTTPTLLTNEDNTITGTGVINVNNYTFKNRGTIVTESFSPQLVIQGSTFGGAPTFHNSGLLKATNGATLSVQAQVNNYEGTAAGTIHADDQSFVRVGSVTGGVLSTSGTGEIVLGEVMNPGGLRDVHNQGLLRLKNSTDAVGTLRNDGAIVGNANSILRFSGPVARLTGTGTYGPQSAPMSIVVGQFSPTMLIHGPDHTIRGRVTVSVVNGGFINQGTFVAEGIGPLTIVVSAGTVMRQQGVLSSPQGQTLEVENYDRQFTNEGLMIADGHMSVYGFSDQPFDVVNAAGATLQGRGFFHVGAPNENPLTFWNQAGGTISGGLSFGFSGTNPNQPKLFRNAGLISPDGHHDSQAQLFMNADYVQESTGVLQFDLGGAPSTGWHDALRIQAGEMSLAGTLEVSLAEGFEPSLGESYSLLSAGVGTVSGMFDSFVPTPMFGKWMSLEYLPNEVLLSIEAITADFDGNGFVDGDDLDDWQLAHQAGSSAADADGDGDSDGRDFLAWQQQYGSGLPVGGLSAAVPEPAGVILLLVGMTALAMRHTA